MPIAQSNTEQIKPDERRSAVNLSAHRDATNESIDSQSQDHIKAQVSNYQAIPQAVVSGRLKNFVALPSDPSVPLTTEQLDMLFPLANREPFIREILRLGVERSQHGHSAGCDS